MRKKVMLVVMAMMLSFCALQARAQSVMAGVGYVGASHDRMRDGRSLNGLDAEISATVDQNGDVLVNARYQNLGARTDSNFVRDLRYYEVVGNFLIPRLNHYVIVGVSSMNFSHNQKSNGSDFGSETRSIGPVTGLAGLQKVGDSAVFNYSGAIHPRAVRTENFSSPGGSSKYGPPASTGYELRGIITHMIRYRFGYSGGYYWRRLAPGMTDHGFLMKMNFVVLE